MKTELLRNVLPLPHGMLRHAPYYVVTTYEVQRGEDVSYHTEIEHNEPIICPGCGRREYHRYTHTVVATRKEIALKVHFEECLGLVKRGHV